MKFIHFPEYENFGFVLNEISSSSISTDNESYPDEQTTFKLENILEVKWNSNSFVKSRQQTSRCSSSKANKGFSSSQDPSNTYTVSCKYSNNMYGHSPQEFITRLKTEFYNDEDDSLIENI